MNKQLNVFHNTYLPWKYLPNIWGNIKIFFKSFKYAWQRATRGYCDSDTWALDAYLLPLLESVLTKFKQNNNGYPSEMTEEQWNIAIQEMIDHFHLAQEENQAVNIYEEPFMSILAEHRTINIDPHSGNKHISFKDLNNDEQSMREKYYTECARIDKERKIHLKKGLALLGEHLSSLWW